MTQPCLNVAAGLHSFVKLLMVLGACLMFFTLGIAVGTQKEIAVIPDQKEKSVLELAPPAPKADVVATRFIPIDRPKLFTNTFASGPTFDIHWETEQDDGARPLEILEAVEHQLLFIQSTPRASDTQARVIALVNEAVQLLRGGNPKPGDIR